MKKKKGKFFKELKKDIKFYFKDYMFNKHHFYYTLLILIILLLSIFLINNYNKCNVYEVSTNNDSFNIDNGILVVTKDDNILKISDISYEGLVKDAIYVQIGLYVKVDGKDSLINSFSATSSEGFNINEYLSKIKFDINENNDNTDVFTNKVKSNIEDSLYLRVSMTSTDNINFNEDIKVRVKSLYRNTKLFY